MSLSEEVVKDFISENIKLHTRWKDTCMKEYHLLGNKKSGDLGELIVEENMTENGHIVRPATCGMMGPWDREIDYHKTEIKFSLSQEKDDMFMINHIKTDIKWERFIFYGWNLLKPHKIVWCTKEDMLRCREDYPVEDKEMWAPQAGDDDTMCTGKKIMKWINSPYTRDIETWDDEVKSYEGLEEFMNDVAE